MSSPGVLSVVLLATLLQVPAVNPAQPTPPPQPASIEGTVVRAGSVPPAPLPRARVVLSAIGRGMNNAITLTVAADDSGRFVLRDVPPDINYNLMSTRDGYVRGTKPVVPKAGQAMTNVVLEMTPTSAISGRIRNRAGDPMGNVSVRAQRYSYREGRRVLTDVQVALTNDLGEFRLYYLEPGRYVVSATPPGGPSINPGRGDAITLAAPALPGTPLIGAQSGGGNFGEGRLQGSMGEFLSVGLLPSSLTGMAYVPVYFPGTMDASATTPIDVAPGTNFTAADFIVSEVRASTIRGRVINGVTGDPAGGATIMLLMQDPSGSDRAVRRSGTVAADGTFEFRAVAPGSYDVVAMVGTLPQGITSGGSGYPGGASINPGPPPTAIPAPRDFAADPSGIRLAARLPLEVREADIDNVLLTAQAGYTVKGRITVEGKSSEESEKLLAGVVVQLTSTDSTFETAAMPAVVRPDGTFTAVGAIPGTYMIWLMRAANLPNGLVYVKSAMVGPVDVINPRFVIDREPQGPLEIVVSMDRGVAGVTVLDAKGAPASGATVVLVPEAPRRRHYDLYQRSTTNDSGTATVSAPVGDYVAYAFEKMENGAWWDPDVMQKYAGQGTPVRIEISGRPQLSLKLLR